MRVWTNELSSSTFPAEGRGAYFRANHAVNGMIEWWITCNGVTWFHFFLRMKNTVSAKSKIFRAKYVSPAAGWNYWQGKFVSCKVSKVRLKFTGSNLIGRLLLGSEFINWAMQITKSYPERESILVQMTPDTASIHTCHEWSKDPEWRW